MQGVNPNLNQEQWDKMYNLKRGLAVANMPLDSAMGYALGSYLKNYIDRGREKKQLNELNNNVNNNNLSEMLTPSNMGQYNMDYNNALTSAESKTDLLKGLNQGTLANATANADKALTSDNIDNKSNPVLETVSLLGAISNLKPKENIITSMDYTTNANDINARQNQQQALMQSTLDAEKQKQQNELGLIRKFLPMSFNNAVASENEVAANSLPEYLKPKIEYLANVINGAKDEYTLAQANNDTEGMQIANNKANAAREELNKLGINSDFFGANKTQEETNQALNKFNYYKEPDPQNISSFQQNLANSVERQLIQAKYLYDNAQTDDERFLAQVQAKNARELAQQYGLDVSSYGANMSLDRAKLAYLNESPKFANSSQTNNLTTQEYWQDIYEKVLQNGGGKGLAQEIANQKAATYQSRRLSDLSNQFVQYGTNPDGSVNNLGMSVLSQLRIEDPDSYTQLLSAYGMPKDQYGFGLQLARDSIAAQNQLAAMGKQAEYNKAMQEEKYALENQNYKYKNAIDTASQKDILKYKASLEQKNNSNSSDGKNLTKEEQKMFSDINSLVVNLLSSARNDDATTSADTLDKYQQELAKYAPYLNDDEYKYFANSLLYVFNFLREKKAGNEDNAREYWNAIPEDMRKQYLPDYSD